MRISGRLCALAVSSLVVAGLFTATPASADNPEGFAGSAAARALYLKALTIELTASSTGALANSSPKAHAEGAGLALLPGTVSTADANAPGENVSTPDACALDLPLPAILEVALACSQSSASALDGKPTAAATSTIAAIDVGLVNLVRDLLKPILDILIPVVDQTISSVTAPLQPLLGPLLSPLLGSLNLDLNSPVQSLVDALEDVTKLATIHVGDTTSSVTTEAGKVTALATAQGGEIEVLPGLTAVGAPLLSIVLGSANATSTFDRGTGQSAAAFDPSLLTVQLLGITVPVGLGTPVTLLAGTPLESTISIGAGRTINNPDGTVGAVADGVSLKLLTGIAGGITLELAHAESAVGGAKASITPQPVPEPPAEVLGVELARTGAEAPWLPMGMMLILAAFFTRRASRARR